MPGGNVGIGTTAPGAPLTFAAVTGEKIRLFGVTDAVYSIGVESNEFRIASGSGAGDFIAFRTQGYAGSERVRIDGSGNVGIGTEVPATRLHVVGTTRGLGGAQILDLPTPGTPTVTPQGITGTTTWGYRITARSSVGETLASTEGRTTTGNATLSATNFNRITWSAVAGAVDYRIYRTTAGGAPSTTGLIGTATLLTFDDTGLAASGAVPTVDTSGNVGIGTTAPGAPLTFAAVTGEKIRLFGVTSAVYSIGVESNEFRIAGGPGAVDFIAFRTQGYAGSERVRIDGSGNVGIGTTAPDHRLHIEVNATDGFPFRMRNTAAGGGTWRFSMPATGSSGVAGSLILNTVGPGGNMMTWLDSGNVGIGTIAPAFRLDVAGASSIGPLTFTGTGLRTATLSGVYTGKDTQTLRIQIDGVGIPNTFRWSIDGGATWVRTGIPITGTAQLLGFIGVSVTFGATTGYTLHDFWQATLNPPTGTINIAGGFRIGNDIFGASFGDGNTAVGIGAAGAGRNTGRSNTFMGRDAGHSNTTGNLNTFTGTSVGFHNTTGSHNTFTGANAGYSNTTGNLNTFTGTSVGFRNTTGSHNTFTGMHAGFYNTIGNFNTFTGMDAGYFNTTGSLNTFTGSGAGRSNTTGFFNTFTGFNAGRFLADGVTANATSNNSVFMGFDTRASAAGNTNEIVIGASAIGSGSNSVTLGNTSIARTILQGNVGIGTTSPAVKLDVNGLIRTRRNLPVTARAGGVILDETISDYYHSSLHSVMQDAGSVFQSRFSLIGPGQATPHHNTFSIGWYSDTSLATWNNVFLVDAITGNVGIGTTAPTRRLTVVATAAGAHPIATAWEVYSDIAQKENIRDIHYGLKEVLLLQPRSFNTKVGPSTSIGFIAQEIGKVIPEVVSGEAGQKGISYANLTALLTKAIQEQQKQIEELKIQLNSLGQIGPEPTLASSLSLNPVRDLSLNGVNWVLDGLKQLGLWFEQGIVKIQRLVANLIQTQELEIGSPETPTGFTIYDKITREPYCVSLENGEFVKTKGKCSEPVPTESTENISIEPTTPLQSHPNQESNHQQKP
ncbi:MAG: hypothetical protein DDT19_02403 [Syntrophomonadaceae bacterium]|nr:hypothetical protein [Bacillota bacterium]